MNVILFVIYLSIISKIRIQLSENMNRLSGYPQYYEENMQIALFLSSQYKKYLLISRACNKNT